MSTSKLQLLSDLPIGETGSIAKDGLNFQKYAEVLGEVAINTNGPFTIGIFGEWGTGKTSLMKLIESYLSKNNKVATIWFNAWRYEKEDEPLFPLLATVIRAIEKNEDFLKRLKIKEKFLTALRAVAYGFSGELEFGIPGIAKIKGSLAAKDMIDREEMLTFDPIRDKSIYIDAYDALSNIKIPNDRKIVIIIDDLDRCFPDHAIKLLESIKLILNQPGFIFIIGVARNVIEGYLQHRYQNEFGIENFRGRDYLDKIVQLPFHIPPHHTRMGHLWTNIIGRLDGVNQIDFEDLDPIIGIATGSNPRAAVRFINNLLIDLAIYRAIPFDENLEFITTFYFAVSRSLQLRWPREYELLTHGNEACNAIKSCIDEKGINIEKLKESEFKLVAELIEREPDLRSLLGSDFGIQWLENPRERNATVDFLRIRESETLTEEIAFNILMIYGSGDEQAVKVMNEQLRLVNVSTIPYKNVHDTNNPNVDLTIMQDSIRLMNAFVFLISAKLELSIEKVNVQARMALGSNTPVICILLPGMTHDHVPRIFFQQDGPILRLNSYDSNDLQSIALQIKQYLLHRKK